MDKETIDRMREVINQHSREFFDEWWDVRSVRKNQRLMWLLRGGSRNDSI